MGVEEASFWKGGGGEGRGRAKRKRRVWEALGVSKVAQQLFSRKAPWLGEGGGKCRSKVSLLAFPTLA